MLVLVTGATGKVGRSFIERVLTEVPEASVRALCHNRRIDETDRVSVVSGSISSRDTVHKAVDGVTHIVHLATCKETPEDIMDVAVKGLFWLLEEARLSSTLRQFVLVGGDAAVGHFHADHVVPLTEVAPYLPYPGCYALSKVLEEVMLEAYYAQYDLNGCCLRAPWIMEKDDFRYTLSFGDDVFGAPVWKDLVPPEAVDRYRQNGTVPCLYAADDKPLKRNFVHVDDLSAALVAVLDNPAARQELFNIAMNRPIDYGELAEYLNRTRGLESVRIDSDFHSNWMDNTKARFQLGWEPAYDMQRLVEEAWTYQRGADEPRTIWYPG